MESGRRPSGGRDLVASLAAVVEASPLAIITVDLDGVILLWNPAAELIFGWSAAEATGRRITWLWNEVNGIPLIPEQAALEGLALRDRAQQGERLVGMAVRRRRRDGTVIDVSLSTAPLAGAEGAVEGVVILYEDIGAAKAAEEAERRRLLRWQALARLGQEALAETDLRLLIDRSLDVVTRSLAVDHAVLMSVPSGESAPAVVAATAPLRDHVVGVPVTAGRGSLAGYAIETGEPLVIEDMCTETRVEVAPVLLEHGCRSSVTTPLGGALGALSVLTRERRRFNDDDLLFLRTAANILGGAIARQSVEWALRDAENRYRTLVERLPLAVYSLGLGPFPPVEYVSPQVEPMLGYPPSAFDEPDFLMSLIHPDEVDAVRAAWVHAGESLEPTSLEYRVTAADGSVHTVHHESHVVRDSSGRPLCRQGFLADITDLRRLEDQIRQNQMLEALGQLAGGIAHEFNNQLAAISGSAELAIREGVSDRLRGYLEEIRGAADQAAGLTTELLALGRRPLLQPTAVDLNALVGALTPALQRVVGPDVVIETRLADDLGSALVDPDQLADALVSLAANAREAMAGRGRLTLETGGGGADPRFVQLTVSDTGAGIDPEAQKHLFEPFTVAQGVGLGLGLATVYGVVTRSGGRIGVTSEPGQGTRFVMHLPRFVGEPLGAALPLPRTTPLVVLLVEDERIVRLVEREVLEQLGFVVIEASTACEALSLVEAPATAIDVLVTDLILPGMRGHELAARLMLDRPELGVVFTSGYSDEQSLADRFPGSVFLQKPFALDALATAVETVAART